MMYVHFFNPQVARNFLKVYFICVYVKWLEQRVFSVLNSGINEPRCFKISLSDIVS